MPNKSLQSTISLLRLSLGFIFIWAFIDKTFGLGLSTSSSRAWLKGGSPTMGYLSQTDGYFSQIFNSLSSSPWVEWFFMFALFGLGVALLLGIGLKIAAVGGTVFLLLLWLSQLPLSNNPFMDQHLIYILLLWLFVFSKAGERWGLGDWWQRLPFIHNNSWLK